MGNACSHPSEKKSRHHRHSRNSASSISTTQRSRTPSSIRHSLPLLRHSYRTSRLSQTSTSQPSSLATSEFKYKDGRRYFVGFDIADDEDGAEDGWIGGGDKGVKEEKAELIYSLPNDDEEIDRLHLQHYMQRWAFGGNFRAPVTAILSQAGCKVLDLGCGSGIWAMEIATDFPITIVTGVDIAPIQASTIKPANLDFITHNILRPFPFADASYDYVHMRSLFLAIPDRQWPSVVAEIVRVLKPGGYVELVEPEMNENGPQLGEAFAEWYKYFYDMTSAKGVGNVGPSLKHYLLSTNAIDDIEEQVRVLPACASPDPTLDRLAVLFRQDYLSATAALKPAILARGKISEIEYDKLVADAHEDMKTGPTGLSVFRVFGRKRRQ